ncbi:Arm DNA-binding domain-containing protein [Aeromonas dhakensis]|uniref:Arm DNA-binding domain-containing protein n=1 Tax=Aeromonas dhakensis TaxID=196024 RepID=UPI0038F7A939
MGNEKQPPRGVTVRGDTINITFTFKGVRCREPLSNLPNTTANVRYASRLLGEIQGKIERGQFAYADYFPKSKKLRIFGGASIAAKVADYLDEYIRRCEVRGLSPSTMVGYRKCYTALADLHQVTVSELTPALVKNWLIRSSTSAKTARNRLSFLRSAIDEAVTDGLLQSNPVSLVTVSRYLDVDSTSERVVRDVDPFTPAEVEAILTTARNINEQWASLFAFAFATGMRPSEICALRWSSIDWIGNTVAVSSATVVGITKSTKTVWVYDMRANMQTFGKRPPLTQAYFASFITAYGRDKNGQSQRSEGVWQQLGELPQEAVQAQSLETTRWRSFGREWIRDNKGDSLDISWLKDQNSVDAADLPEPLELANEAKDELEAALAELQDLVKALEGMA